MTNKFDHISLEKPSMERKGEWMNEMNLHCAADFTTFWGRVVGGGMKNECEDEQKIQIFIDTQQKWRHWSLTSSVDINCAFGKLLGVIFTWEREDEVH